MNDAQRYPCAIIGCDSVMASWRLTEAVTYEAPSGTGIIIHRANDMLCQSHYDECGQPPATGIWEEVEQEVEKVPVEAPEPHVTLDDLLALVRIRESQGIPEAVTIQQAIVGVNALFPAAERWARLEAHGPSSPVWLRGDEAVKLVKVLRGVKGPEARLLMQEIRDRFSVQ